MKPKLEDIIAELNKRSATPFRLKDYLFPEQYNFVMDESPFKVAVTSRRSGKTVACAADLAITARSFPEVVCLYITLARNNARKLIWPELKRLNSLFKMEARFNESELSMTFPNGSVIYCSGASDRSEIDKFRGLALKKVYIDECQSFPSYIGELIDDVIAPALMDYAGSLSLIGTPGPIPAGFFYDCSQSPTWASHKWTFFNNPFIAQKSKKSHQWMLNRELARRGVSVDDPSIQREFFGQWVLDTDSLVYQYSGEKNDFDRLPSKEQKWQYILGVDIGYHDADALAVLGWTESDPATYLVEELVTRHQGITELVEQITALRKKYDFHKIVMDTGGLGKKIQEEIIKRYQIAIVPAEKTRKVEFIELMNDAMRTAKLKAPSSSRFAQDCMKVEWDRDKSTPDKKKISSRFHSDICEAVLYAWRESYSFTHRPEAPKLKQGTPEWQKKEQEEMEERALEHFLEQEELNKDPFQWD